MALPKAGREIGLHKAAQGSLAMAGKRKLTEDLVRQINALRWDVPARELAQHFGVSTRNTEEIWKGRNWRHVGPK
jgi:hypothetical protein